MKTNTLTVSAAYASVTQLGIVAVVIFQDLCLY
jgi:hypothetical protein